MICGPRQLLIEYSEHGRSGYGDGKCENVETRPVSAITTTGELATKQGEMRRVR